MLKRQLDEGFCGSGDRATTRSATSSARILGAVVATAAVLELLVMAILAAVIPAGLSPFAVAALDALLLVVLVTPALWLLVIKPTCAAMTSEAAKFATLLEAAPDAIIGIDSGGRIRLANAHAEAMFGHTREELRGQPVEILVPERTREDFSRQRDAFLAAPSTTTTGVGLILAARRKDGGELPVEVSMSHVTLPEGPLVLTVVRDISAQKKARAELMQMNQRLQDGIAELAERTQQMHMLVELGELLQACQTAEESYAVIGRSIERLFPSLSGSLFLMSSSLGTLESVANWGDGAASTQRVFKSDACWALRLGRAQEAGDAPCPEGCRVPGTAARAVAICLPLTARKETLGVLQLSGGSSPDGLLPEATRTLADAVAEQLALGLATLRLRDELRNQSIRDPLTGLFNRRFLEEWLGPELRRAARGKRPLSVLLLDLDHFKRFNDSFGHEGGDMVLREVGALLRSQVRAGDVACRLGGEELAVLLPEARLEDAAKRAEQIRRQVEGLAVLLGGRALGQVTVSIGVSAFPQHGDSQEALLRAADAALYEAKAGGRNRVVAAEVSGPVAASKPRRREDEEVAGG